MELLTQLMGEMLLCGLLSELVYQPPSEARLQSLYAEGVFTESPLGDDAEDIRAGLARLQAWGREHWDADPAQALADLQADYLRLFVGLGKVLAPPWESVYFSDEQQLFQEQTLQVRAWYRKYGLQIEHLHNEPDDHIGMELGFLAHLAQFALQALAQDDLATVDTVLKDQSTFLTEHLMVWSPRWSLLVEQHASTDFYRGLALLVRGALAEVAGIARLAQ
jgi:TorA maturation chaperone TorD